MHAILLGIRHAPRDLDCLVFGDKSLRLRFCHHVAAELLATMIKVRFSNPRSSRSWTNWAIGASISSFISAMRAQWYPCLLSSFGPLRLPIHFLSPISNWGAHGQPGRTEGPPQRTAPPHISGIRSELLKLTRQTLDILRGTEGCIYEVFPRSKHFGAAAQRVGCIRTGIIATDLGYGA